MSDLLEDASLWCMRISEGALTPQENAAFRAWLAEDPTHLAAFDEAVAAWQAVQGAGTLPEVIKLRTAALDTARRAQGRSRHVVWTALAASIAAVVVVGSMWWRALPDTIQTSIGERRVVMLEDGSKLSIDSDTRLTVKYGDAKRELKLLQGRAKFDVAKNPLRPFTVTAGEKVVVATGTEFSVELLQSQVRVVLYEGGVSVVEPRKKDVTLTPGHELVASKVAVVDTKLARSWEAGQISFVDEPLSAAVERMNRYSKDKLVIGDVTAGNVLVNGIFTAGDTAAFVEGIAGVFPVDVVDNYTFVSAR